VRAQGVDDRWLGKSRVRSKAHEAFKARPFGTVRVTPPALQALEHAVQ